MGVWPKNTRKFTSKIKIISTLFGSFAENIFKKLCNLWFYPRYQVFFIKQLYKISNGIFEHQNVEEGAVRYYPTTIVQMMMASQRGATHHSCLQFSYQQWLNRGSQ